MKILWNWGVPFSDRHIYHIYIYCIYIYMYMARHSSSVFYQDELPHQIASRHAESAPRILRAASRQPRKCCRKKKEKHRDLFGRVCTEQVSVHYSCDHSDFAKPDLIHWSSTCFPRWCSVFGAMGTSMNYWEFRSLETCPRWKSISQWCFFYLKEPPFPGFSHHCGADLPRNSQFTTPLDHHLHFSYLPISGIASPQ